MPAPLYPAANWEDSEPVWMWIHLGKNGPLSHQEMQRGNYATERWPGGFRDKQIRGTETQFLQAFRTEGTRAGFDPLSAAGVKLSRAIPSPLSLCPSSSHWWMTKLSPGSCTSWRSLCWDKEGLKHKTLNGDQETCLRHLGPGLPWPL